MNKRSVLSVTALIFVIIALVMIVVLFAGCGNNKILDTTWRFERAIITLPDGSMIEGSVEHWTEYKASDMLQVKINGKTYLTHSSNIILIAE